MAGEDGYNARDFVIKMAPIGGGAKVKVAAVRGRTVNRTREPVNTTNDDSNGWRKLLPKPGTRGYDVSIEGVATSENYYDLLQRWARDDALESIDLEFPDGTIESGPFFLAGLQQTGSHDGEITFTGELQSADEITKTAPAAPSNVQLPALLGTPQVGVESPIYLGAWKGETSFAWKIQRDEGEGPEDVAGATGTGANLSYTPVAGDEGHPLYVVVTATNSVGSTSATSGPTADVLAE